MPESYKNTYLNGFYCIFITFSLFIIVIFQGTGGGSGGPGGGSDGPGGDSGVPGGGSCGSGGHWVSSGTLSSGPYSAVVDIGSL